MTVKNVTEKKNCSKVIYQLKGSVGTFSSETSPRTFGRKITSVLFSRGENAVVRSSLLSVYWFLAFSYTLLQSVSFRW